MRDEVWKISMELASDTWSNKLKELREKLFTMFRQIPAANKRKAIDQIVLRKNGWRKFIQFGC